MHIKKLLFALFFLTFAVFLSGCGGSAKPIAVTLTAASTTVDGGNAITITASLAGDSHSAGVTWALTGGGTLSNTTTTSATYTAPAPSSSAVTATITATSIKDTTKTQTVTITVPAAPAITTAALSGGAVGGSYALSLSVSGGIAPYTWTLTSGALPAGLTLNSDGTITGAPLASGAGTYTVTFKVTDSGKPTPLTATVTLTITVAAAPPVTVTTALLADATLNAGYSASVAATGGAGALTYSLASGALPAGLALSPSGAISGTPTVVGSFTFTVAAADTFGDSGSKALTLDVNYPQLTVTPATLPDAYVGSAYAGATLHATGGSSTGYAWSLANGTALPAGLTLSGAGAIAGTATTAGTTSFTLKVTDSATNTATLALAIVVKPAITITTASPLAHGYVGSVYSATLVATGGSGSGYTWVFSSGSSAPAGLSLSSAGVLGGTPTAAGAPTFNVTVTDSASNTKTAAFAITISPAVSITTASLPDAYQTGPYMPVTITAAGGDGGPYTWTWAAAGGSSLPAGMQLSTTGVVSGTPTASGNFNIIFTAKDGSNNLASATLTLKVESTLTISPAATLPSGTKNIPYLQPVHASGGSTTGYVWTTTGPNTLAAIGLSFNTATGSVEGTPPATGSGTFTAVVTDSQSHTAQATLTVTIYNAITITTASLPSTDTGVPYSQALNAGGGTGTGYTWSATSSNLATFGLSLSAGGVISGTPTGAGAATFTAKVTDSGNNAATQALSITIYNALTLPSANPFPQATTGGSYTGSVSATGGSGAYSFSITGLPANGLSASSAGNTVTVSGTPAAAGPVPFSVTVTDTTTNQSVGPMAYSVGVVDPQPLVLPSNPPPSATVNTAYNGQVVATGGVGPYTWTVNSITVATNQTPLALSNGLSVTNDGTSILKVVGTPLAIGPVSFTAAITDHLAHTAGPANYSVTVNSAGSRVSGNVSLMNSCGPVTIAPISLSIDTTPVKNVMTDANGNFTFNGVPNGTYTITPSISGPSSMFYPSTIANVVVNNADKGSQNFQVALGYSVSGTLSYAGSSTGRVYVSLSPTGCGNQSYGTSLSSAGAYTVRGVPPGAYTLASFMDIVRDSGPNTSDPSGSSGAAIQVTNADVTGADVSLQDPTVVIPPANPQIQNVSPTSTGVAISFKPVVVGTNHRMEAATSYIVQWADNPSFTSPSAFTFKANGGGGANIWILNDGTSGITGNFDNGPYYFRARAANAAGSPAGWSYFGTQAIPLAVTIGAPAGGSTISGTVTFAGTATGPLYAGFYDFNTNRVYGTRIAAPTSPQAFSVNVPNGSSYFFFGVIDQNNDGLFDVGDITNTNSSNETPAVVNGNGVFNLTLPSTASTATLDTYHWKQTNPDGMGGSFTNSGYQLDLDVRASNKLPVKVTLQSGPQILHPIDVAACSDCGTAQFRYSAGVGLTAPQVGDTYSFAVTYSDGSSENVQASVTGVSNAFVTSLSPFANSPGTTPTFTWTDPASASNYTYQFQLTDSTGHTIWQVPGQNGQSKGLNSSITSLAWGVDPTDGSNTPNPATLTAGQTYYWSVNATDADGNSAQRQIFLVP